MRVHVCVWTLLHEEFQGDWYRFSCDVALSGTRRLPMCYVFQTSDHPRPTEPTDLLLLSDNLCSTGRDGTAATTPDLQHEWTKNDGSMKKKKKKRKTKQQSKYLNAYTLNLQSTLQHGQEASSCSCMPLLAPSVTCQDLRTSAGTACRGVTKGNAERRGEPASEVDPDVAERTLGAIRADLAGKEILPGVPKIDARSLPVLPRLLITHLKLCLPQKKH